MTQSAIRQIVLASRPKGSPTLENFRLEEVPMPSMPPGGLAAHICPSSLPLHARAQNTNDLLFREPRSLHRPSPLRGRTLPKSGGSSGAQVLPY